MTFHPLIAVTGIGWGFDCEGSQVQHMIGSVARPQAVWAYDTGSDPGIPWTPNEITHYRDQGAHVYLVNQGATQGPGQALHGDEFDFENGAWTLAALIEIITARRAVDWSTRIYCSWGNYALIKAALAVSGIGRSVYFRIADWNLNAHLAELELHADVYAGQWASPTSNPGTLIPGTSMTLADAVVDLNVVLLGSTGWAG